MADERRALSPENRQALRDWVKQNAGSGYTDADVDRITQAVANYDHPVYGGYWRGYVDELDLNMVWWLGRVDPAEAL